MERHQAEERIKSLREEINRHNHNYYILNKPEISDKEFDMLLKELEALEKEYPDLIDPASPTQRVGSDLTKGFEHVVHARPMMSLANSYSVEEVDEWFDRVRKALEGEEFSIVGELKFDGTSISLTYRQGRLVRAVTRGDGTQGDDVTANVRTIRSVPLQLQPGDWPEEFEIRGEVLMPWKVFERLNAERAYNEEPLFANPRNAASGTLKMQDPRIVAARHLDVRLYYLLSDHLPYDNHYDNMEAARRWGFKVSPNMKLLHSLQEVDEFVSYWDEERRHLPVATDGLVFKVNSLRQQLNLGYTAKSPRWAIAFKFNPENACTRLRFVSFETGRMGIVTPVANLEPVLLSGTTRYSPGRLALCGEGGRDHPEDHRRGCRASGSGGGADTFRDGVSGMWRPFGAHLRRGCLVLSESLWLSSPNHRAYRAFRRPAHDEYRRHRRGDG